VTAKRRVVTKQKPAAQVSRVVSDETGAAARGTSIDVPGCAKSKPNFNGSQREAGAMKISRTMVFAASLGISSGWAIAQRIAHAEDSKSAEKSRIDDRGRVQGAR